jgi:hypothetical protein
MKERYYPGISLEGLRKSTKKTQDCLCIVRDSNKEPAKNKSRAVSALLGVNCQYGDKSVMTHALNVTTITYPFRPVTHNCTDQHTEEKEQGHTESKMMKGPIKERRKKNTCREI